MVIASTTEGSWGQGRRCGFRGVIQSSNRLGALKAYYTFRLENCLPRVPRFNRIQFMALVSVEYASCALARAPHDRHLGGWEDGKSLLF